MIIECNVTSEIGVPVRVVCMDGRVISASMGSIPVLLILIFVLLLISQLLWPVAQYYLFPGYRFNGSSTSMPLNVRYSAV